MLQKMGIIWDATDYLKNKKKKREYARSKDHHISNEENKKQKNIRKIEFVVCLKKSYNSEWNK